MGQKAIRRERLAVIRDRVWEVLSSPDSHSLMTRERALDSLAILWESERGRVGPLLAC
ncbi:hypothetical protein [Magnetospirillum fulvum]|jgi:hypothetical protein|uniref:Uncharacterized protein n=1 Tax=Magnetospirillum fulvum TaxID=1082 RepID=A0A1H6GSZ0_MAGFU|nr:hypothetical protein [Magnetospirillum fulvum]SEH24974.1 hypothetical protein SAMN04244559_00106 [Magnetospirillum fulvum]